MLAGNGGVYGNTRCSDLSPTNVIQISFNYSIGQRSSDGIGRATGLPIDALDGWLYIFRERDFFAIYYNKWLLRISGVLFTLHLTRY